MVRITRPVKGSLRVTLPYRDGGTNFDLLRGICGPGTHVRYNSKLRCFEVARVHLPKLIDELPAAVGTPVELVLHGAIQTTCVSACWDADPDTWWQCTCSCAGENHGTRVPLATQISADLSVGTQYTSSVQVLRSTP